MSHARAPRARAHVPFFVHSSICDISFPGKLTMLDTFLTFKLIFEHSWFLTKRAHTTMFIGKIPVQHAYLPGNGYILSVQKRVHGQPRTLRASTLLEHVIYR